MPSVADRTAAENVRSSKRPGWHALNRGAVGGGSGCERAAPRFQEDAGKDSAVFAGFLPVQGLRLQVGSV